MVRDDNGQPRRHEAWGVIALAASGLLALALWSYDMRGGENWVGPVGAGIAGFLIDAFGVAACVLPFEALLISVYLFRLGVASHPATRAASMVVSLLLGCAILHLSFSGSRVFGGHLAGGVLGEVSGEVLRSLVGLAGAYVVCLTALLVTVILRTSISVVDLSGKVATRVSGSTKGLYAQIRDGLVALVSAWREAREIERAEAEEARLLAEPRVALPASLDEQRQQEPHGAQGDGSEQDTGAGLEGAPGDEELSPAPEAAAPKKKTVKRARKKVQEPTEEAHVDDDGGPEGGNAVVPADKGPVIVAPRTDRPKPVPAPVKPTAAKPSGPFILPSESLLDEHGGEVIQVDTETLKSNAVRLVEKLEAYGVKGRVDEIHPGPVVTMYEFEPKSGTKVSKIAGLADDLAMALAAQKVRIVAPIPGKARVGFELPNENRQTVYLRDILEDARWTRHECALPVALGKDIAGQPVYGDLSKMPHVLVAGATGAGKSVGLNVMLASLLMKKTPEEVRLLMIDPKVVELAVFDGIPHMLLPVVTDMKKASLALRWAVDEMERRYQLFADVGARNISTYNARVDKVLNGKMTVAEFMPKRAGKVRAKGPDGEEVLINPDDGEAADAEEVLPVRLPSIVLVVDEFADLMMVAAKDVESAIARLAQKARAAGLHVILATQRPSVDVITGMIKANFPSRIAFKVSQREDSKTILGRNGAEHLLGMGDMLTLMPGSNDLRRVHSAFITEDEVKDVCDFLREQASPIYDDNILKPREDDEEGGGFGGPNSDDPQYDKAIAIVAQAGYCSISHIQRNLSVGYNKAAKLVERMEREGVVGPPSGKAGGRREVFVQAP